MLPFDAADLTFDEERFRGATRLFPLPDLVMYPHVVQPLHVFESRYREMLNEALDSDGLITMCLLDDGWEEEYDGRPPLYRYGCLGKVITHRRLDDGTYNLMVLGQRRVRLVEELPPQRSYREARVDLLEDVYPDGGQSRRERQQTLLLDAFQEALAEDALPAATLRELLAAKAPLGVLTDLVAFALPLAPGLKRALLAECDVDRRAARLLSVLRPEPTPLVRLDHRLPFSLN